MAQTIERSTHVLLIPFFNTRIQAHVMYRTEYTRDSRKLEGGGGGNLLESYTCSYERYEAVHGRRSLTRPPPTEPESHHGPCTLRHRHPLVDRVSCRHLPLRMQLGASISTRSPHALSTWSKEVRLLEVRGCCKLQTTAHVCSKWHAYIK